ncbi:hypothetical protein IQ254_04675 [Nodosilinea sp. LEGE 07088]|uniref:hypothetical protein n=1 Tax=Nodosilinea sp. LEGE 07088 TaxID=2777968 RepID=UPI00187F0E11|nr:hypothetical protein [Nodosilinea sp. LEGE 07088]MBE9136498.1 hypothetical protein [Nodosilinea sp. LEGE 07088]
MASANSSDLGIRQIQQTLWRAAKTTLIDGGIQPNTRRGNKELDLAVQRLAQQPYRTIDEVNQAGQDLGQKIIEISQAQGKTNLDGGIVRQMMLTGEIATVTKAVATKPTPIAASQPQTSVPNSAVDPAVEAIEADVPEIEAIEAEIEAIEADVPEVEAIAGSATATDVPELEAMETVDPVPAEDLAIAEIETLDSAAIAPPEPEPMATADIAAVETVESA